MVSKYLWPNVITNVFISTRKKCMIGPFLVVKCRDFPLLGSTTVRESNLSNLHRVRNTWMLKCDHFPCKYLYVTNLILKAFHTGHAKAIPAPCLRWPDSGLVLYWRSVYLHPCPSLHFVHFGTSHLPEK